MSGHGSPFIAHHFDDAKHQFDSGKLGIWAFLAQEVLFFSALFVAYIIYRYNHPEIYEYAHYYLDTKMGAINTAVLICSSLSAAWAVRAAQLNQKKLLIFCLVFTILCAFGFLGIKYVEYSHKIHEGILFGKRFNPAIAPAGTPMPGYMGDGHHSGADAQANDKTDSKDHDSKDHDSKDHDSKDHDSKDHGAESDHSVTGPVKDASENHKVAATDADHAGEGDGHHAIPTGRPPPNTGMFFTIYFAMTGLHGIHVIVGIGIFFWLLVRAMKGHFNEEYYGPIDFAALYWHLVDLIWIYLFPLLYLIH